MRSPFVQRQTLPRSGFAFFCPLFGGGRSRHPGVCPDGLSLSRGRAQVAAPHTSGGASAVEVTMAAAPWGVTLGGRATSLAPHAVLRPEVAARLPCARACEARRRGRIRPRWCAQRRRARSSSGRPSPAQGAGSSASGLLGVHRHRVSLLPARAGPVAPTGGPVRRPARPLLSLPHRSLGGEHTRVGVGTWPTRPGLLEGPGRSPPCLGAALAPSGGEPLGPPEGPAPSARRPPRRPRGERQAPAWC